MSLAEGSGSSSASESAALGEMLAFFGSVADYAAGAAPGAGGRIASLAVAIGAMEDLAKEQSDALYFAARLRNIGALGNPALAKGEKLNERDGTMAKWDIPAHGARLCEHIAALPRATADIVRWQAESWDGTGFPDQLRWTGIPITAQILHIARTFADSGDPEEALTFISANAGRAFAPEQTRSFVMWYHTNAGEIAPLPAPNDALSPSRTQPQAIVDMLAERIDAHNGTPGRSARIAQTAQQLVQAAGGDRSEERRAATAARLFGIGELRSKHVEHDRFDPLARLGIELRAENAAHAERLLSACEALAPVAPIVRARAEWFDGTGAPDGLRSREIPGAGHALALAIAYDALEQMRQSKVTEERTLPITRLETASGTQFDPVWVRALASLLKMHA